MQGRVLLSLLLVCAAFSAVVAIDKLRGVKQSSRNLYSGEYIECDGGKKLPIARVNDDFCDCKDGADEPGTSACSTGRFFCVNKGYRGSFIPSSWVDDGKCDCCDGSDELSGKCENTCTAAAKLHMVSVEKEIQTQESGLRVRAQYVADAARDIESKKKELVQQEAKLVQLELKAAELEQIKKTEEDKYNAAREVVEKAVREREQKLVDEAKAAGTEDAQLDEEKVKSMIDDDDSLEPTKQEFSADDSDVATGYDENGEESLWEQLRVTYADAKLLLADFWQLLVRWVTPYTDKERAEANANEARNDKDATQREVEKLKKFLALDFGTDAALHAIHGHTFEWSDREYTYKLNAYNDVTQSKPGHSSTLGRYKEIDSSNPHLMIYDSGDRCWGAPDRSTKVTLICGDENKVLDVKEPNKCEYALTFQTPAACSQASLDALKLGE